MYRAVIIRNAESSDKVKGFTVVENLPATNGGRDAAAIVRGQMDEGDKVYFIDDTVAIDYLRFDPGTDAVEPTRRSTRPHSL